MSCVQSLSSGAAGSTEEWRILKGGLVGSVHPMGTSSGVAGGATGALGKDYYRIEGDPASPLQLDPESTICPKSQLRHWELQGIFGMYCRCVYRRCVTGDVQ